MPCGCAAYDWTGCDLKAEHHPECASLQPKVGFTSVMGTAVPSEVYGLTSQGVVRSGGSEPETATPTEPRPNFSFTWRESVPPVSIGTTPYRSTAEAIVAYKDGDLIVVYPNGRDYDVPVKERSSLREMIRESIDQLRASGCAGTADRLRQSWNRCHPASEL